MLEKKPFSKKTLLEFDNGKLSVNSNLKVNYSSNSNPNRLIASPNLMSKFSPSVTISKSPSMTKRSSAMVESVESKNLLNKFALNKQTDSKNIMNKYAGVSQKNEEESKDVDENVNARNIPVNRKNKNNLKNIEELPKNNISITVTNKIQYTDLPITGAVKQGKKANVDIKLDDAREIVDYDSDDDIQDVKYEAYMYKITQSKKIKKLWFKLIGRDLYCMIFIDI